MGRGIGRGKRGEEEIDEKKAVTTSFCCKPKAAKYAFPESNKIVNYSKITCQKSRFVEEGRYFSIEEGRYLEFPLITSQS